VKEKKVDGGIGKVGVAGREETAVIGSVLAEIAKLVGWSSGPSSEKVFDVEEQIVKGTQKVGGEGTVRRQIGGSELAIGPKTVVEDLGHDAAVGVVPAGDASRVARVESVLKDGLMRKERNPFGGAGIAQREQKTTGRDVDLVGGQASE